MGILLVVILLAAVQVVLVALVIKVLFWWGAPETSVPAAREALASPAVSSEAAPVGSPGGRISRAPGRVGARHVDARA